MQAAIDGGITAFDTAFSYGMAGESDRLIARHLSGDRDRYHLTSKVGQRYEDGRRVVRCDRQTLRRDLETALDRCGIDSFDLVLLHDIDPSVPVEESAVEMGAILSDGLAGAVGVCNATLEQIDRFASVTPVSATQCGLNRLQPDNLESFIPGCVDRKIQVGVFWTLMKGLLAGRIRRGHEFADGDSRPNYEIFQGQAFENAQRELDRLDRIAAEQNRTVAQLAIRWVLDQPGVTTALVGARTAAQVREIAAA